MGEGRRLRGGRGEAEESVYSTIKTVKKRKKNNIIVSLDKITRRCLNKYIQKAVANKTFSRLIIYTTI